MRPFSAPGAYANRRHKPAPDHRDVRITELKAQLSIIADSAREVVHEVNKSDVTVSVLAYLALRRLYDLAKHIPAPGAP